MDKTPLEKLGYKIQNSVSPASMTPLQKLGYVNAFKEEDHPRAEDGKFGSGGGGGEKPKPKKEKSASKADSPKKEKPAPAGKNKDVKAETTKLETEYKQLKSAIRGGDLRPGTENYFLDRLVKIQKTRAESNGLKYDPAGNTDWQRKLDKK